MIWFLHLSIAVAQIWEYMADMGYCEEDEQKIFRSVREVRRRCRQLGIEMESYDATDADRHVCECTSPFPLPTTEITGKL